MSKMHGAHFTIIGIFNEKVEALTLTNEGPPISGHVDDGFWLISYVVL